MPTEEQILQMLDYSVYDPRVQKYLQEIVERVQKNLDKNGEALLAWEPIPLHIYHTPLPGEIKSSWIFILRKNTISGAERHPNSIQRMMSFRGKGNFQTKTGNTWHSNFLESENDSEKSNKWLTIPQNTWHQGVVGNEDWVILSFHTCTDSELIEERPAISGENEFIRQTYSGRNAR